MSVNDQNKNKKMSVDATPPRINIAGERADNINALQKLVFLLDNLNAVRESVIIVPRQATKEKNLRPKYV